MVCTFTHDILEMIIMYTYPKITQLQPNYRDTAYSFEILDKIERMAFLGSLYLTGDFKSPYEDANSLRDTD